MSKYHARKVTYDNILFDSELEFTRYLQLKLLENAGAIVNLEVHPVYELAPRVVQVNAAGKRQILGAIRHELDFRYSEYGRVIVEDVKGMKTPVWRMKHNLFQRRYPEVEYRVITREDM